MKKLSKSLIEVPQRPVKVIQFGEGNFLRAFTDWTIQKMNDEADYNGSVALVQPLDRGLIGMLSEQDFLYTHYLKGIKKGEAVKEHLVNNSISMGIDPYANYEGFLNLAHLDSAEIILSNTTEAGIAYDAQDVLAGPQKSYPGKLTALLYERYDYVKADPDRGFVIIPCELIDKNGDKLKEIVLRYATDWELGDGFIQWIQKSNQFCNSLVDRIVPGFPRDQINEIWEELGYEDNLVVESEQFDLWVIEGPSSIQEIFPVHKTACHVLFVDDMTPYRTRKVRILNGAHTTLVPVAYLYGMEAVKESVEDEVTGRFVKEAIFDEIILTLDLPQDVLDAFAKEVIDRFRNPFVHHELMSIALNSMSKYKTRVLPSVIEYLEQKGELPKKLVFSLASLFVFYRGLRGEEKIALNDSQDVLELFETGWEAYDGSAESLKAMVQKYLAYEAVWETNLNHIPHLEEELVKSITLILEKGMKVAISEVLI